jgi:RNA binding exosome subunit
MQELPPSCKLKDIKISCSVHATEDTEKVKQAMLFLLPEELRDPKEVKITPTKGHANNPIVLLDLTIRERRKVKATIDYIATNLKDYDKEYLRLNYDTRVSEEENSLYLRFDKQEAFKESLLLGKTDNVITFVLKIIIYKKEPTTLRKAIEACGLL